ncbi:MAG TPA: lasso peptide biosynthesis B2 protein [Gemmatimonadaceae bacterium]|nr:lasso peptide biosynthesis B2 protein [Gemmatimonadaceae bacterium]
MAARGWGDIRAAARAQLDLLVARFLLWRRPIGKLVVCSEVGVSPQRLTFNARAEAELVALAIDRAARLGVFRPSCLVRALALHRSLERRGIVGSIVRIGVRRSADALLAHAWVEHDGVVLGDTPAMVGNFTVLTQARLADLPGKSR